MLLQAALLPARITTALTTVRMTAVLTMTVLTMTVRLSVVPVFALPQAQSLQRLQSLHCQWSEQFQNKPNSEAKSAAKSGFCI